jgi:uncharacterized membrane protein YkvA (DUF1232 family)
VLKPPVLRRAIASRAVVRALRDARRPGSPGVTDRLAAVPAMLRDTATGRYSGLSRARMAAMAAAAAYVVSPVDLVPEALLFVVGVGDDFIVGSWLAGALLTETERYLEWKGSQGRQVAGNAGGHR